jgi:hypothetical protein
MTDCEHSTANETRLIRNQLYCKTEVRSSPWCQHTFTTCSGEALQQRQHFRQLRLIVLQIGIRHRREWRVDARSPRYDTGARKPSPPEPAAHTAHAGVFARKNMHHIPSAIGGVVVAEDDFSGDAVQRRFQLACGNAWRLCRDSLK